MADEVDNPWVSLDIDETDLSSSPSSSVSLLRRCNNHPPSLSPRHVIPGPAAAIQAAMHRKTRFDVNSKQPLDSQISTQEYHRRLQQDSGDEFLRNPWLFSLNFLRNSGVLDRTPLSQIKKCVNAARINWVVAIVKSCTPNGLGDMRMTLKDPTDTIDATVHGKVLTLGNIGKSMTVGSVLVLQKVISVECDVQNSQSNLESTPALSRNSAIPVRPSAMVCGRIERVIGDVNQSSSTKGAAVNVELTGTEHYLQPRSQNSRRQLKDAADKIMEKPVYIDLLDSGCSAGCYSKSQGEKLARTSQPGPGSLEGIFRSFQDLDNYARPQAKECSSVPSITENLGNQNGQANDGQAERMLQGNNCKNADDLDSCDVNDIWKQQNPRLGISSAPGKVENLTKRCISGGPNTPRSLQLTESRANSSVAAEHDDQQSTGSNSVKKQKLALKSRTALQEWTDEQLCILDMDGD